jgi:hypothetical protein
LRHFTRAVWRQRAKLRHMKSARFTLPCAPLRGSPSRLLLIALLGSAALMGNAQAGAQWKWKDANGAVQYSDRPPPAGTPEHNVLSRPAGQRAQVARAAADAASGASAPAPAASTSVDPELEAKRKKAEDEKQAKKKADEEKSAAQRADNCQRARGYQRSLQDGIRITRSNAAGEREVLDDKGRAEEMQRTQDVISSNCK